MRIVVDEAKCQGHTLCAISSPDLFGLRDEDGHSYVVVDDVPAEHQDAARRAAASCPERAINIVD